MFGFLKRRRQAELAEVVGVYAQGLHDALLAEFRAEQTKVLCEFAAKLAEILAPSIAATQEIEKSCRLLIDGQALVEKTVNRMAEAEEARDREDESWKNGRPPVGGD